jgi:hypothetical protein
VQVARVETRGEAPKIEVPIELTTLEMPVEMTAAPEKALDVATPTKVAAARFPRPRSPRQLSRRHKLFLKLAKQKPITLDAK